jgi:endonuclease/exonuclease/phosphatase family metal-dependent hydrolase
MDLRILSYNIHKCTGGLDRRYDPARTAKLIASVEPDIVLLQEVAENGAWYRKERQVDVLGDLLGMPHRSYFVNVRFGPLRGHYGNAILSRHPIASSTNIDLTQEGKKARSVLHAEITLPVAEGHTRTLHAFNLHLGLGERERRRQLVQFLAAHPFSHMRHATPVVVGGDFNDVYGTIGPQLLAPNGFVGPDKPLRTFPAYAPLRALDGIYVRGDIDLVELDRVQNAPAKTASDHLALLAKVRVRAGAP